MTPFFFIVNFPFISSNIPAAPVGAYISHHTRYSRACVHQVIFWIDLSCCSKNYSNKAMLLLDWNHFCKYSTVVITNWLLRIT